MIFIDTPLHRVAKEIDDKTAHLTVALTESQKSRLNDR